MLLWRKEWFSKTSKVQEKVPLDTLISVLRIIAAPLVWATVTFNSRSRHQRCSIKKLFLEISQNWQENTFARFSFSIKLQASILENSYEKIYHVALFSKVTRVSLRIYLTHFFPVFLFDPPENIRKLYGFLMFSGGSKRNIGKKWVKVGLCSRSFPVKLMKFYTVILRASEERCFCSFHIYFGKWVHIILL